MISSLVISCRSCRTGLQLTGNQFKNCDRFLLFSLAISILLAASLLVMQSRACCGMVCVQWQWVVNNIPQFCGMSPIFSFN